MAVHSKSAPSIQSPPHQDSKKLDSTSMSENLIEVRGLTKKFGDFVAVNGIDFHVQKSESFGFLGPNGAGKSTTMRILAATSRRTSGEVSILGKDPEVHGPQIRAHLGVVPQEGNLDVQLTVTENLYIYGRYFGLSSKFITSKIDDLLEFAQLEEKRDVKVEGLSGGMKRRLIIARALVSEPDILVLDEPTTGLDPQARHILWDRLFRLKEDGMTLLITTHFMDEAEQLCDRLIVMDKGSIMAEGSPNELIKKYSTKEVLEVRFGSDRNADMAPKMKELCERIEVLPDRILLYTEDAEAVLESIIDAGHHPNTSLVRRSSLEDVFLRLTGRSLIE
ncbi:daunorubicin/doxorubicin resistance ATP-binding protein DrrA [mine drainage metagenome]|uniref:Daunorubicin/doxorubicin resistance ATP-binding protein DrrA n=1 Tax=mine drainage metagenome TaxID=410659 RepID=A0A1J5Q9D3_9ZZZZ